MDRERFDAFTRMLAVPRSRRGALGIVAAALAIGSGAPADARKGRKGRRGRNAPRGKTSFHAEQVPASCFTGTTCTPKPGANLAKCDFGESDALADAKVKGANLGGANLRGADASGADLRGANLGKACLVDADLTGALINGTTNQSGAIYCRTVMPNGSINDSGCDGGTRCCPTCIEIGDPCGPGIEGECCDGETCRGGRCGGCQNDAQCPGADVCCNTVCCDDEAECGSPQCPAPTCQQRCSASCEVCLSRLGGGRTCSGSEGGPQCGCNSDADCDPGEICITGGTYRNQPLAFAIACVNAQGACARPTPCG